MINKSSTKVGYRPAINAVRGFAALFVVFYHIRYYSDFDWFSAFPIIKLGYLGVDFFFVLSGLIISHTYLKRSRGAHKAFWLEFIWYRLARLFPVHFLIMILMLVGAWIKGEALSSQDMIDWLGQTFLMRQWVLPDAYAWNSPAWSISAELFAYVFVFPLMAWLAPNLKSKADAAKLIGIGVIVLLPLVLIGGTVNIPLGGAPLIRVVGGFIIGCGLFILLSHYQPSETWDKRLKWLFLGTPIMLFVTYELRVLGYPSDILLITFFAFVISCIYLANGRLALLLSARQLFWLGEISFALYICHIPVMKVVAFAAKQLGLSLGFHEGLFTIGL